MVLFFFAEVLMTMEVEGFPRGDENVDIPV